MDANGKVRILVLPAGSPAEVREIRGLLRSLQEIVGGPIESTIALGEREQIAVFAKEDGKLGKWPPPNIAWMVSPTELGDVIVGDCVAVAANDDGDTRSLTPEEVDLVNQELRFDSATGLRVYGCLDDPATMRNAVVAVSALGLLRWQPSTVAQAER